MRIAVVVGNPKPKSRTWEVARTIGDWLVRHREGEVRAEIDLADHAPRSFAWPDPELDTLTAAVADSDVVIVASPTYKATYTGLLKAFLDRYAANGLAGVTAVPVMTGGSPHHSMAVETGLRPVLVELGASVPTRGLYFEMSRMDELGAVVDEWAAEHLRPGGWFAPARDGGKA